MAVLTDKTEDVASFRSMIDRGHAADMNNVSITSTRARFKEQDNVAATSTRYRNHRIFNYHRGNMVFRILETWEAPVIPPVYSQQEKFFEVSRGYRARADLVAITTLGNKYDWWWILFVNNFLGNDEIEAGMTLRIPRPPYQQPMTQRY